MARFTSFNVVIKHLGGLTVKAPLVRARCASKHVRTMLFALLSALTLAPLSISASSSEEMETTVYGGYIGCDRWMHTNFFTLMPGQGVSIKVDLTECDDGYFKYGFIFYGYKEELANYLAKKDGIEFQILDAKPPNGEVIDPDSYNGCYLSGKTAGVWLDLKRPGKEMWLTVTNTKRKPQLIRLQSSTNIIRPRGC